MSAELHRIDGRPVLRFERVLAHPPAKVWRAVTEPGELAHWFPAAVAVDGREMTFSFPDQVTTGEVLESDPPRVFAFRWGTDVLRFELLPHERGCLLVFTHVLGDEHGAGRNAAGWDTCLAGLEARLGDRPFQPDADVLGPIEHYVRRFGLDEGRFEDGVVRFVRDLVWRPLDEVWALLAEGAEGVPVRATNPHVPAGPVVERVPPRVLAFDSPTGRVRWEFHSTPERGTTVELTHVLADRVRTAGARGVARAPGTVLRGGVRRHPLPVAGGAGRRAGPPLPRLSVGALRPARRRHHRRR